MFVVFQLFRYFYICDLILLFLVLLLSGEHFVMFVPVKGAIKIKFPYYTQS